MIPMAELRKLAGKCGLSAVETLIQSGNLVFEAGGLGAAEVEARLEAAIERRFGFSVAVIVRTRSQWKKYAAGSPFAEAERMRPGRVLLALGKSRPARGAAQALRGRATLGERIEVRGDAIWVDFAGAGGKSELKPARFDQAAGSPVTMRNWNTVRKLDELLEREG
jgi:uncharacterized protein (DUF1697 family)